MNLYLQKYVLRRYVYTYRIDRICIDIISTPWNKINRYNTTFNWYVFSTQPQIMIFLETPTYLKFSSWWYINFIYTVYDCWVLGSILFRIRTYFKSRQHYQKKTTIERRRVQLKLISLSFFITIKPTSN